MTPSPAPRGVRRDRGMVTAELAAAMPVAVGLAVLAVGVLGAGIDQIRCVDAARVGARALARGDPADVVAGTVRSVAPAGASLVLGGDARTVQARVRVVRPLPGGWGSIDLGAVSSADRELAAS